MSATHVSSKPHKTDAFRARYRQTSVPDDYDGQKHIAKVTLGNLSLVSVCIWGLSEVQPLEWLTIPAAFLLANLVEYLGHRYPMHKAYGFLKPMCVRHAAEHHRFFTEERMATDQEKDWYVILVSPIFLAFFGAGIGLPIALVLFAVGSANIALLFAITACAYALTYEWLHLAYHLPEDSFLGRRWLVRKLRPLHWVHHDPGVMAKANFNITFPIFDLAFGTFRPQVDPNAQRRREEEAALLGQ